jgi:DNA-binding CsgD family transcriptional regulator
LLQIKHWNSPTLYLPIADFLELCTSVDENEIDRALQAIDPVGCILNSEGVILDVSAGWRVAARKRGLQLPNDAIGANYLRHCVSQDESSLETYRGFSRVLSGKASFFGTIYPCYLPTDTPTWFLAVALKLAGASDKTLVLHFNVSQVLDWHLARDGQLLDSQDALIRAIRSAIREELANGVSTPASDLPDHSENKRLARLTSRQRQLLGLIATGYSNAQIAKQLGIAVSSVKSQTTKLLRILDCANRTQAALIGARLGLNERKAGPRAIP